MAIKKIKKGFSLVEIIIVVGIVSVLATLLTTTLNPIAMMNRARDAQRKKDLNSIKIAFEEYQSDKGSYPGREMVASLTDKTKCKTGVFKPWLASWPCDPNGNPYFLLVEANDDGSFKDNPRWYKVLTYLEDRKDKDIPKGWYAEGVTYHVGPYTNNEINHGISSSNVAWHDILIDPSCSYDELNHNNDLCFVIQGGTCKAASGNTCTGTSCYAINNCAAKCKVTCCGSGCY